MARAFSRLLRRHIFKIATLVAFAAVLVSGLGTYRALDVLPGLQRQILVIEDGLQRMIGLRGALGVAAAHARLLGRSDQETVAREIAVTTTRGLQMAEEMLSTPLAEPLRSLIWSCQNQLQQLASIAAEPSQREEAMVSELAGKVAISRAELLQQITSGRDELSSLRDSASSARSETAYQLLGGHALILSVIGLLYFARDAEVRRRQRSDSLLLEADERFALIVRCSADGIILADSSGRIQMTNPALDEMFAATDGQLVGRSVSSLFETTLMDEWLSNRGAVEREPIAHRIVSATRCDGARFDAELAITRSVIRDQEFLAISVRDVSDREVSRVRLAQQEALLSEIPEPLLILDACGRIVYWNLGAERLYGYSSEETIGRSANDILKVVQPEGESDNVHAIQYADANRWTGELRVTTKAGHAIPIERRRTRIVEGGDVIGEVIFDLDLEERTQLQVVERRRQRLEALGTLASGVAHDLNNLLTPILMSSRMLQRGGTRLDSAAMLETIAMSASRAAELIAQLLTFARGGKDSMCPLTWGAYSVRSATFWGILLVRAFVWIFRLLRVCRWFGAMRPKSVR